RRFAFQRLRAGEQTQYGFRGTLPQRSAGLLLDAVALRDLVEELDHDRETDRRVEIALGQMEPQAVGHQAETDHEQEAQTQHDYGRMRVDERSQRLRSEQHDAD